MNMYKLQDQQSADYLAWERMGRWWPTNNLMKMNQLLPVFGKIILTLKSVIAPKYISRCCLIAQFDLTNKLNTIANEERKVLLDKTKLTNCPFSRLKVVDPNCKHMRRCFHCYACSTCQVLRVFNIIMWKVWILTLWKCESLKLSQFLFQVIFALSCESVKVLYC